MQGLFYQEMSSLVEDAPRPDVRRSKDSAEASRHFIDFEAYGDSAAWKMPMKWDDAVKRYSIDTLNVYGFVPYHIITMQRKLTEAFRSVNKDSILFYAADLAHYIGDANVPLHTSLNYDGQLTNQKGLHSLWESMIPEIELASYNLYSSHKATYLKDPEKAIWKALRDAHLLVKDMLAKEIEATKGFTDSTKFRIQIRRGKESKSFTSAFAKAYSKLLGETINQQLLRTADLIADFWYTAWVDAGKPNLKGLMNAATTDAKKSVLKEEQKAYKNNELITGKFLLSWKNRTASSD